MAPYDKQHFSPTLANRWWADDQAHYVCFYRDERSGSVAIDPTKGRRAWGHARRVWSKATEQALDRELETPVAPIYRGMLDGQAPRGRERVKWAQFLLSQFVRTPTFIRYEKFAKQHHGITNEPDHDRVGCEHCGDLDYATGRDWVLLVAHADDFFVRTDNPVLLTGPLERTESAIFYPLTPRACFVALPLHPRGYVLPKTDADMRAFGLPKGAAHMINFNCCKHADQSLIVHPKHHGQVSKMMLQDSTVFGAYPQAPFLLHAPHQMPPVSVYASVQTLQSMCDRPLPAWNATDLENIARRLLAGAASA